MDLHLAPGHDGLVRSTFEDFFRKRFASVARAAALVAGDAGSGQDLAQEAFLRLYERWGSMESEDHARNFVYKVAINLARSHVRKHLRLVPSGLHHADMLPALRTLSPDGWLDAVAALRDLSRRQRACVVLIDLVDMDAESAASVIGITTNTVRVHLMRGRRALRRALGVVTMEDDEHEG